MRESRELELFHIFYAAAPLLTLQAIEVVATTAVAGVAVRVFL